MGRVVEQGAGCCEPEFDNNADSLAAGFLFTKLSRSTRNDRSNRRASKAATSPGAVLNLPMELLVLSGKAEKE